MTSDEKERIRRLIPHNFVVFSLDPAHPAHEAKLKSAEWQIIMQIDGKKSVQDIIEILSLSEDNILPLFFGLYEKKLVEITEIPEPGSDYITEGFFEQLKDILVQIIGPVAVYVIDDALLELNEDRQRFHKDKIALLTESISNEILDEDKRVKFQQEMLGHIKNL